MTVPDPFLGQQIVRVRIRDFSEAGRISWIPIQHEMARGNTRKCFGRLGSGCSVACEFIFQNEGKSGFAGLLSTFL